MANLVATGVGFIPYEPDISADNIIFAYVPATDGTALGIGSPVKKVGTGNAAVIALAATNRVAEAHGLTIGQLPTVTHADDGANDKVFGVVVGVLVDHNNFTAVHKRSASTEAVVKIARMLPGRKFRVRSDAAVPAASVGLNVNMKAGAAVTSLGFSDAVVDGGNAAADATYQFKIVAIGRDPNQSDVTAAGVELIVEPNIGYDMSADAGL